MEYIKASSFRQITVPFTVKKVYDQYRNGGVGKGKDFKGRTFRIFEVNLEEKVWGDNGPSWVEASTDIPVQTAKEGVKMVTPEEALGSRDFFFTYKKVFDVVIETEEPIIITETRKGEEVKKEDKEFTINGLGSFKVQGLLKADINLDVPMVDVNGEEKEVFDWEDDKVNDLVGNQYQVKVTGTGLGTEYRYNLIKKA